MKLSEQKKQLIKNIFYYVIMLVFINYKFGDNSYYTHFGCLEKVRYLYGPLPFYEVNYISNCWPETEAMTSFDSSFNFAGIASNFMLVVYGVMALLNVLYFWLYLRLCTKVKPKNINLVRTLFFILAVIAAVWFKLANTIVS